MLWRPKKRVNRKGYDMNSCIYYAMRSIGKEYVREKHINVEFLKISMLSSKES